MNPINSRNYYLISIRVYPSDYFLKLFQKNDLKGHNAFKKIIKEYTNFFKLLYENIVKKDHDKQYEIYFNAREVMTEELREICGLNIMEAENNRIFCIPKNRKDVFDFIINNCILKYKILKKTRGTYFDRGISTYYRDNNKINGIKYMKKFKLENHISEYDLKFIKDNYPKFPIEDDFGKDLILKNYEDKNVYTYVRLDKDGYREINLKITSFLGSYGAEHYYGTFKCYDLNFTDSKDKIGKSSMGGVFTKGLPEFYRDFLKLELKRPCEQKDLDNDKRYGRDRWGSYEIGDLTRGFWTEEEIIEVGKEVFKKLFKGKWKLNIESYYGDKDEVIYLT